MEYTAKCFGLDDGPLTRPKHVVVYYIVIPSDKLLRIWLRMYVSIYTLYAVLLNKKLYHFSQLQNLTFIFVCITLLLQYGYGTDSLFGDSLASSGFTDPIVFLLGSWSIFFIRVFSGVEVFDFVQDDVSSNVVLCHLVGRYRLQKDLRAFLCRASSQQWPGLLELTILWNFGSYWNCVVGRLVADVSEVRDAFTYRLYINYQLDALIIIYS